MKSQVLEETFFMAHGLTRMQRIFADLLFNPYRVNDQTRHSFYNSLCPTGNKFFLLSSSRLTVLQSYSLTVL